MIFFINVYVNDIVLKSDVVEEIEILDRNLAT